jgi:hydrogenase expression/formation protein HypD
MRFVDEYRSPELAQALAAELRALAEPGIELSLMEVCGGHTHAIYRHGITDLLPPGVELVHGPGCPVCVLPLGRVDDALFLARRPGVLFTTFADMLRVPGSRETLLDARADGADVRMVYSPLDALELARRNPERQVVFFAIGFETTAPSTAITLLRARAEGIGNFSVFCNHVTIEPALRGILDADDVRLDGLVGPGHVSTVIGSDAYRFVAEEYGRPVVVAGFEPLDILQAIAMLVRQAVEGRCEVENQYTRAVSPAGNGRARAAIEETMEPRDFEWRGLGELPASGLRLRDAFAAYDAERLWELPHLDVPDAKACQCGQVLRGALKPYECRVFGTACTPERPLGTCMVSSEGACAAYFQYGRREQVPA